MKAEKYLDWALKDKEGRSPIPGNCPREKGQREDPLAGVLSLGEGGGWGRVAEWGAQVPTLDWGPELGCGMQGGASHTHFSSENEKAGQETSAELA